MAATPKEFMAKLGDWQKATEAKLDALARQVCYEMGFRVVMKTPVDTGFLRGSWQPSIGQPADAKGATDPAGAKALSDVSLTIADVKAGDRFYMLNNASYARFVEYGTTRMAARYYVSDTVANWQGVVSHVAAELGMTP